MKNLTRIIGLLTGLILLGAPLQAQDLCQRIQHPRHDTRRNLRPDDPLAGYPTESERKR